MSSGLSSITRCCGWFSKHGTDAPEENHSPVLGITVKLLRIPPNYTTKGIRMEEGIEGREVVGKGEEKQDIEGRNGGEILCEELRREWCGRETKR